ncbi:MAG: hypothetical protein ACU0B7_06145 [Paracoccaceae bacterium]|uniref:hypothetical protein n=1 Tax=Seohaeicola saemankumensis TaxID=481181 RepID=UPI001E45A5FA|nr:hypothetical protein [Seohaeicola saemankumensis]MCD1625486.1 hypothetical protein [Seohaeicola saemankumensis]
MVGVAEDARITRQGAWHLVRDGEVLTLSRHLPARFDVSASLVLQGQGRGVGRARLAHQVRQDVWRRLRDLRGFRPVVRVVRAGDSMHLTAGGALQGGVPAAALRLRVEAMLYDLLSDPARQSRWLRHAGGAA